MRLVRLVLAAALTLSSATAVGATAPADGAPHAASPQYVYVAPSGDDDNPGTVDRPFRTIERARDAVRDLIADGMTSDVVVVLGGGTYYVDKPIRLDERDSGRDGHQVVYTKAAGEQPVIVGGRPITGWEPVDDEVFRAPVPDLNGAAWTFNQLFVDDERATLAREPDGGYFSAEWVGKPFLRYRVSEAALFEGIAEPSTAQVYVWPQRDWFSNTVAIDSIDTAAREVIFQREILHTLQSQRQNGNRYFVQGFAEALDEPGEWYLDRNEGYVYYRPADPSVSPNEQEIVAPTVQDVFNLHGSRPGQRVHDIVIDGLDLSVSAFTDYFLEHQTATASPGALRGTVWNRPAKRNRHGIIRLENSRDIDLRGLEIRNAGFSGISIDKYSRDVTVTGNEIHEYGYHGIIVTGVRAGVLDASRVQVYDNHDHTITDNHLHDGGKLVGHGGGVFLNQSGDNLISHNLIHDMPRYGICVKGLISTEMAAQLPDGYDGPDITWENHFALLTSHRNVISFNDIHTVLQDSEDAGGISFKGIGKGTIVENNHIHDYEVHRGHNKAVYLDDGSSFTLVKKNVVHGLITAGAGKTYNITAKGYGNRVTNNVLVAEDRDGIGINSAQIKNEPIFDHVWDHNIFYAPHDRAVLYSFQVGDWFPEWVKAADHNLAYSGIDQYNVSGIPGGATWENWKTLADGKYDLHSLAADPLFVDPEADDFRLRPESPAFDLGIESIDVSTVGPRPNPADARVELAAPPEMRPLDTHVLTMTVTNDGDLPLRGLDATISAYTPNGLEPLPGRLVDPPADLESAVPPGHSVTLHWRADIPLDATPGHYVLLTQVDYQTVDGPRGKAGATAITQVPSALTTDVEPTELITRPGTSDEITVRVSSHVDELLTFGYAASASPEEGVGIDPQTAEIALPPGASREISLALTGRRPGSATVELDLTARRGDEAATPMGTLAVDVQVPYGSLAAAFDNVGITDDAHPDLGTWGAKDRSYSAQALANAGITSGGVVSFGGVDFTWPDVPAGTPDNVQANGQLIALSGSGSQVGFLGTSDGSPHEGTGTIHYRDGTTSTFRLRLEHWAFPERVEKPVVVMPYVNQAGVGREDRPAGLYFASAPVDAVKAVTAVELPAISAPDAHGLHVFAMAIGS